MAKKQSGLDKSIDAALAKHDLSPEWAALKSTLAKSPGGEQLFEMIFSRAQEIARSRGTSPDDVVLEAIKDTCRTVAPGVTERLEAERLADSKSRRRIPIRDKNGDLVEVIDVPLRRGRE